VLAPQAVLVRSDLSKDVELLVLRHENQVMRRQLGDRRPWWDHADRLWLAGLSRLFTAEGGRTSSRSPRSRSCAGIVTWSPASGPTPTGAGQDDQRPAFDQDADRADGAGARPGGIGESRASWLGHGTRRLHLGGVTAHPIKGVGGAARPQPGHGPGRPPRSAGMWWTAVRLPKTGRRWRDRRLSPRRITADQTT
jgi:hypothetical protein